MKANLLKVVKWLLIVVACLFVAAQFKRPAKTNPATEQSMALESQMHLQPPVAAILDRSCNDCHSNKTRWPWYANVAPVSWFVIGHVEDARDHLNFSEWGNYSAGERKALLGEFCEMVTEGFMPLSSYTPLHPGSKLSDADKKVICDWSASERARIP